MVLAYSLGPCYHFARVVVGPDGCFVPVLRVFALLDPGLAPRRFGRRCFELHVLGECLAKASVIASASASVIASASAIANAGANANVSANASASFWDYDR